MKENVTAEQGLLDNEHGYLGLMLRKAANAYKNKMEKILQEQGITASQFTVLNIISTFPQCSNADVARMAYLTPQTVNLIVNKLVKMDAVQKNKHSENKLIQLLEITPTGGRLLTQCNELVLTLENQLAFNYEQNEQAVIRKWLSQIIENEG